MSPHLFRLALITLSLAACGGPPQGGHGGPGGPGGPEQVSEPDRRVLVGVATVERGEVADYLVTTGILESEAQADIVPETAGVVTQVLAEEGDAVRRGQVLAVISSPSLDANASRASVELDQTRRSAEEAKRLHTAGVISDQDLRDSEAALRVAEATFQEAAASRGFTRISSPIAGTVSIRDVRLGEMAGSGRAFQVVDLNTLRVVVQLPERDLHRIRLDQPVRLSGAYDDSASASGRVERISPVVDAQTGTVRVTIAVDAPPEDSEGPSIRPGQFVKVRIEVGRHADVLTIPRRALVWIDGEPVAWQVVDAPPEEDKEEGEATEKEEDEPGLLAKIFGAGDKDEKDSGDAEAHDPWEGIPRRAVDRRRLEVGYMDPDRVEVMDGLSEGDMVVEVGNANLRQDSLVRLPDDPSPKDKDKDDIDAEAASDGASGEGTEG